jgi:nucleoid DNA-binding protein
VRKLTSELRKEYAIWKAISVEEKNEKQKKKKEDGYAAIAELVEKIWNLVGHGDPIPPSIIHWGSLDYRGRATRVTANPLTSEPKGGGGRPGSAEVKGWDSSEPLGNRRAHLLHEDLHGPGEPFNLTPSSESTNKLMYYRVEEPALKEVEEGKQLYYETIVTYQDSKKKTDFFAKHISMKAIAIKIDKRTKTKTEKEVGKLEHDNY